MNCLDTTYLVDFLDESRAAHAAAREWMDVYGDEPMYGPAMVRWELHRGAARLGGHEAVERLAAELDWLGILPFSSESAVESATIEAELSERNEALPPVACAIAGVVRRAGASLVTSDPGYTHVDGLDVDRYDIN